MYIIIFIIFYMFIESVDKFYICTHPIIYWSFGSDYTEADDILDICTTAEGRTMIKRSFRESLTGWKASHPLDQSFCESTAALWISISPCQLPS